MKIKKSFLAVPLALSPLLVEAQPQVNVLGGVSMGYVRQDFPAKLDSTPTFPVYTLTGSILFQDAYLSLSYGNSFSDEQLSEEEDTGDASRTDTDLTLGYRFNDEWTFFVGYKDGETDIDFVSRDDDEPMVRDEYYRQDGFYVGTTYQLPLGQAGSLNFTLGYSDLDSDNRFVSDADEDEDDVEEFDDLSGRQSGSVTGLSYGISWQMPVAERLAVNVSLKVNDYEEEIKFDGKTYKADQKFTFFNVGLLYAF